MWVNANSATAATTSTVGTSQRFVRSASRRQLVRRVDQPDGSEDDRLIAACERRAPLRERGRERERVGDGSRGDRSDDCRPGFLAHRAQVYRAEGAPRREPAAGRALPAARAITRANLFPASGPPDPLFLRAPLGRRRRAAADTESCSRSTAGSCTRGQSPGRAARGSAEGHPTSAHCRSGRISRGTASWLKMPRG